MNRLNMGLRALLGITLMLNLSVCDGLFASDVVDPPPPATTGPVDADAFWSIQQSVFSYLFDADLNPAQGDPWAYPILDGDGNYTPVTGTGQYTGRVHTDQNFSFACTMHLPVALDFSTLPPDQQPTPEQIQKITDEGWQMANVAGILATGRGQVPIVGVAMAGTPGELGYYVSYVVVAAVVSADSPLIVGFGTPGVPVCMAYHGAWYAGTEEIKDSIAEPPTELWVDPDPTNPACQGCHDDYNNTVNDASHTREIRPNRPLSTPTTAQSVRPTTLTTSR